MKRLFTISLLLIAGAIKAQVSFSTQNTPVTTTLRSVQFADTATGYACGDNGAIIKTTNGGQTWTQLNAGTVENLWDMKIIPGGNGQKLIVVGASNTVRKSVDGGQTWQTQTIPFQPGSFVFGIQCIDSSNYYACGGDFATYTGAILKTSNGGQTWTKVAVPNTIFLDKLAVKGSDIIAVGTNLTPSDGSINKSTNGGTAWSTVNTSSSIITNIWTSTSMKAVAVGLGGQIWKTTDGGNNWTSHSFNGMDLYGIQFKDSLNGFACGGDVSASIVLSTIDGGNTWTQVPYAFNATLQSVCMVGNHVYLCGDQGRIAKATLPAPTAVNSPLQTNSNVSIYYDPGTGKICLKDLSTDKGWIRIIQTDGRLVQAFSITERNMSVTVAPGTYLIQIITSEQSRVISQKVMVP